MAEEIITEAENKLAHLVVAISKDRDFCIPLCLLARQEGITEKLVDFLEHATITDEQQVWDWVFSEEGGGLELKPLELVDDDEEDEEE